MDHQPALAGNSAMKKKCWSMSIFTLAVLLNDEQLFAMIHTALVIVVLVRFLYDFCKLARSIKRILGQWPMRQQPDLLTEDDIITSLEAYSRALTEDEVCPFCRGPYTKPLELSCRHLYCRDCVEILMEHNHDRCGLCRQQYYDVTKTALSAEFKTKGVNAKRTLIFGLLRWMIASAAQILVVAYWKYISCAFIQDGIDTVVSGRRLQPVRMYPLLMAFEVSYVDSVGILAKLKIFIEVFDHDWLREVEISKTSVLILRSIMGVLLGGIVGLSFWMATERVEG